MEALRRLRRGAANTNVDRRLVTNILLTFLNTPREDTKRFEILGLLSSILSWSDEERVRAGLQRMVPTLLPLLLHQLGRVRWSLTKRTRRRYAVRLMC
jgi:hypothetical protein